MNLKQIDAAIASYRDTLDESGLARLSFFRTLWGELDRIAKGSEAEAYRIPETDVLRAAAANGMPVFEFAAVSVDEGELVAAIDAVARLMAEQGGFAEPIAAALSSGPWERAVRGSAFSHAGSDPEAFVEAFALALEAEGMDEQAIRVSSIAAMLALRALIDAPARQASEALRCDGAIGAHALRCPVCGGAPAIARVGETDASQGRGRELWCAQCGTAWPFERVRCARCGTRNQAHLHYTSIEGDLAHRLALCDECGGYIRTVYQEDAIAPFSYEVEDVVTAPLDAVAAELAADEEMRA